MIFSSPAMTRQTGKGRRKKKASRPALTPSTHTHSHGERLRGRVCAVCLNTLASIQAISSLLALCMRQGDGSLYSRTLHSVTRHPTHTHTLSKTLTVHLARPREAVRVKQHTELREHVQTRSSRPAAAVTIETLSVDNTAGSGTMVLTLTHMHRNISLVQAFQTRETIHSTAGLYLDNPRVYECVCGGGVHLFACVCDHPPPWMRPPLPSFYPSLSSSS